MSNKKMNSAVRSSDSETEEAAGTGASSNTRLEGSNRDSNLSWANKYRDTSINFDIPPNNASRQASSEDEARPTKRRRKDITDRAEQNKQYGDPMMNGGAMQQGDNYGTLVHNHHYHNSAYHGIPQRNAHACKV